MELFPINTVIPTHRYKFTCAYDGTDFYGWQIQPGLINIQGTIETVLAGIVKAERVKIHGSGRTDHGVHAKGQVFHCDIATRMYPRNLKLALNSRLPESIRIISCQKCEPDFHARRSATAKEYRYSIWNQPCVPPDKRLYNTRVVQKLDVESMQKAALLFLGEHDFIAFSVNPQRPLKTTVRKIFKFTVQRRGSQIIFAVRGNGFLYKMVRSMVGFLIRVGSGKEKPENVTELLASKVERTARVPSAPPHGLSLWRVWYSDSNFNDFEDDDND